MKAVAVQHGKVLIIDKEKPYPRPGHVLIRVEYSAISPGTEMIFIRRISDHIAEIGYSAVGIVEQLGEGVCELEIGQRVACYGAPYVQHAQWLSVPVNLTAIVPDHVDPKEAAFAGLGAIAIHALRVADLKFGESAVVVGLGILGNIIAQIANAAAFRTTGYDLNEERAKMVRERGLPHFYSSQEQMEAKLTAAVGKHGADAIILCASGPGEVLINRSFSWLRDRGKIVIVGDLSTEYTRGLMFGKEAQVLISRAGGPGRYDTSYEQDNIDYPIGFVRWTEGRNIGEYIRLLAEKRISIQALITDVYKLDNIQQAYDNYIHYTSSSSTIATLIQFCD